MTSTDANKSRIRLPLYNRVLVLQHANLFRVYTWYLFDSICILGPAKSIRFVQRETQASRYQNAIEKQHIVFVLLDMVMVFVVDKGREQKAGELCITNYNLNLCLKSSLAVRTCQCECFCNFAQLYLEEWEEGGSHDVRYVLDQVF